MFIGIAICVVFVIFAVLMMTKKLSALLALPLMAIIVGVLAGLPLTGEESIIDHVIVAGALKLAGTYVAILFACWLSQILYKTGVTDTIIKKAAELGGDKPFVVALLLCGVSVFLFTVLFGTGAVAMVGAIVLPLLLSIGVPALAACNVFMAALSAGYTLNPANMTALLGITGITQQELTPCAIVLTVMGCVFTVLYLIWSFKKNGMKFAFAAPINDKDEEAEQAAAEERPMVHGVRGLLACLTPVVVVVITLVWNISALAAFFAGVIWAIIFTVKGPWKKYMSTIVESCFEGFKEGAPTAGLMFGIGMLLNAVTASTTQTIINPFMTAITPTTAVALIIFACVLCPLSLYRGPFNIMGLGAGLAASMMAVNALPVAALAAVFYCTSRWPAQACPTATQVVWVSNFTGYDPVNSTNQVQIANWVFTALSIVICVLIYM